MEKRVKKDKEELKGLLYEPKNLKKEVKVQDTGRQFIIQLPREFVRALEIRKGDIFVIEVPLKKISEYSIKLKRKVK